MGFLSRLFRPSRPTRKPVRVQRDSPSRSVRIFTGVGSPIVAITGTTTHRKVEARAMMRRYGQGDRGHLEIEGRLTREWVESISAHAVAVTVDGEPIGYLSFADSKSVDPRALHRHTIAVQAFSETVKDQMRVEAWAWLAPTLPRWEWSEHRRPPLTSTSKAGQRHRDSQKILSRRSSSSPEQARAVESGRVRGAHYLELVEPIKQAKREGKNQLALEMCYAAIQGAERDRMGSIPAPAYTEHAAIVLRKLKRRNEEIEVLERYLRFVPYDRVSSHPFMERIRKIEALKKKESE